MPRVAVMVDSRFGRAVELPATSEDELQLRPEIAATDRFRTAVGRTLVPVPLELMSYIGAVALLSNGLIEVEHAGHG